MNWPLAAAAAAAAEDVDDDDVNERFAGCCLFNRTTHRSQLSRVCARCMILLTTPSTDVCSSNKSCTTSSSVYIHNIVTNNSADRVTSGGHYRHHQRHYAAVLVGRNTGLARLSVCLFLCPSVPYELLSRKLKAAVKPEMM